MNEDEDKGRNKNKNKSNYKHRKKDDRALVENEFKHCANQSSITIDSSINTDVGCIKTIDCKDSSDDISNNAASKTNNIGNALAMTPLQKYSVGISHFYVRMYTYMHTDQECQLRSPTKSLKFAYYTHIYLRPEFYVLRICI
jgi:hypothetical protein